MDDVVSGCVYVIEALKFQPDLIALLTSVGFPLRKQMVFQPSWNFRSSTPCSMGECSTMTNEWWG
jgi:hypothetical protein